MSHTARRGRCWIGMIASWRRSAMFCALSIALAASIVSADELPKASTANTRASVEVTPPHEPRPRLTWHADWPRFRPIGYALMGASVASAVAVTLLVPYPNTPRWTGGILFDAAVRDALRARTPGLRDGIRTASDLTLATTIVHVTLIDSLIVPLAGHSPDVAFQLLLMDAQAFSLNLVISTLLSKIIARARPAAADCARDPSFDPLCRTSSFASIPSGHTSTAFTAAGLTCVHHAYLPLYGGDGWDTAACVSALSLASATGLFRILGDRHYVSDVILGAALGFSIGYVYPWLFHYIGGANDDSSSVRWGPLPGTAGTPYGASAIGFF